MPEKTVTAPQVTFRQATRHPSTCYPPPATRHPPPAEKSCRFEAEIDTF